MRRPSPSPLDTVVPLIALGALMLRGLWPLWPALPRIPVFTLAAAAMLGICLWWVVKRQFGPEPAVWVAWLFAGAVPLVSLQATLAGMAVFPFLYTAVGMAHATQGPMRKWPPRIALGTVLACLLGAANLLPITCMGFAAATAVITYLAWPRLRQQWFLLVTIVLAWALAAMLGTWLGSALLAQLSSQASEGIAPAIAFSPGLGASSAIAALMVGIVGWISLKRSRWFGNNAPLLAGVAFVTVGFLCDMHAMAVIATLPLALLFYGGVLADGLESKHAFVWRATALILVVWAW